MVPRREQKFWTVNVLAAGAGGLLVMLAFAARAEGTTSTLRLADLFQGNGIHAAPSRPRTGTLNVPDTSQWRLPSPTGTPVASPATPALIGMEEVPRLPMLIARQEEDRLITQPPFIPRGNAPVGQLHRQALVRIETAFHGVCAEYRLIPAAGGADVPSGASPPEGGNREAPGGSEELVTLHAPQTSEQFALAAGEWSLEVRLWEPVRRTPSIRRLYAPQDLLPGAMYEFQLAEDEERLLEEIRRAGGRR